jgi:hypothetical protein
MKKVFCIQTTNIGVHPSRAHVPPCLKGHHYTVLSEKYEERRDLGDGKYTNAGIWYTMVEMGKLFRYNSECFIDVEDDAPDMDEIVKPKEDLIKL